MIDIYLLRQLDAFARCGTLSAAAEELYTSQPALTRSMKKLEDDLGVSLFTRGKNRLALNEVGKLAAKYAAEVLEADRDFEEKVKTYARNLRTISIGFCAPVPQMVLTPLINTVYDGMTVSADMSDDEEFVKRVKNHQYHLAVVHEKPDDSSIYSKKCGHEDLYLSLKAGDPLAFYPQIHLSDLGGRSILLLSNIGFWADFSKGKTPDTNYLLQVESSSFVELSSNSDYPSFTSSHFISQGHSVEGKINVKLADEECHADYYLICLKEERSRHKTLFDLIDENTVI